MFNTSHKEIQCKSICLRRSNYSREANCQPEPSSPQRLGDSLRGRFPSTLSENDDTHFFSSMVYLPDARRRKPRGISGAMLCRHKGRLAQESHSDHNFSTFCTNCPCVSVIFKKQRDESRQIRQRLPSWQVNCLTMGYSVRPNPRVREGSCSFPVPRGAKGRHRSVSRLSAVPRGSSQPRRSAAQHVQRIPPAGQRMLSRF